MADLFASAQASKKPPSLHSDTEIYLAVDKLGAYLIGAISNLQKGMKGILGEALLYEATEMAEEVRQANIARGLDKLRFFDALLSRLEKVQYLLRNANAGGILPHKTYGASIEITESIGRQANGLKNDIKKRFHAPASSPVT